MKTIDIKGKPYVEVNERIKYFWENNKDGAINTEMLSNDNGVCVFKATIYLGGVIVSTGHAYEKEGSTFINKTSYIENCETSAVGRALGNLGIGIDTSVASYEEVSNAIAQQNEPTKEQKDKNKSAEFLDKYEKELDLHGTVKSIEIWEEKNTKNIKKNLLLEDQKKLRKYINQIKEIFQKSEQQTTGEDVPL